MTPRAAIGFSCMMATTLVLAGCSTPPDTLNSDANGITLRWVKSEHSFDDIERIAQAHCTLVNRHAVLAEDWADQYVTISRFACR